LALLAGGACWFAIVLFLTPGFEPGVTIENSYRIRIGMSEDEVEVIMGCPGQPWKGQIPGTNYKCWGDGNCGNVVSFDDKGRVDSYLVMKNTSTHLVEVNESVWEKLCQWFHVTPKKERL
jgi:hypothetical protein